MGMSLALRGGGWGTRGRRCQGRGGRSVPTLEGGGSSLIPRRSHSYAVPTFTRALAAEQIDFEGLYHSVPSGAARMQGARLVENLFRNNTPAKSEDNTAFNISGAVSTTTGTIVYTGGGFTYADETLFAGAGGRTFRVSVDLWMNSGSGLARFVWVETGIGNTVTSDNTITTERRRFSVLRTINASATNVSVGLYNGSDDAARTINATNWQLEDVTGQTITAPSESVSVGVLSAPYHGAGVDGVKYFDTLNGNTVASNVVTEATGAAINSAADACAGGVTAGVVDATGPLEYLYEGAATNSILQSNTLGTTWTISHADDMEAVSADQYVSVDGATTMDKLQPKATTAVHSLDQAFTFTAAKYTTAVDFRYVAATPQRWVAIICNDGTTTWGASFDLSLGVVGAVSAGATSGIEATALANVYRCWVTNTANAAAAAGTVKISLNATDTATLESAARAGTETLGAGMVQHEVGTFKTSRTTTTTVAVARPTDLLNHPTAGNLSSSTGSAYAEVTYATPNGNVLGFITSSGGTRAALHSNSVGHTLDLRDTSGVLNGATLPNTSATVLKIASSWGGSTAAAAVAGTVVGGITFSGDLGFGAAIDIGPNSDATKTNGTIRGNWKIYGHQKSARALAAMTLQ